MRNLIGDLELNNPVLLDDLNGEILAGFDVPRQFDLSEIALAKSPSQLVLP